MNKVLIALMNKPVLFVISLLLTLVLVGIVVAVPLRGGEFIVRTPGIEVQMTGAPATRAEPMA